MARLRDAITPRTKVVAVTWVHSGTGVKLPLHELGDVEPLVVVDGVHALGVTEPRVAGDVLIAGTHKWLGGPRGTGLIWTRAWDRIRADDPELCLQRRARPALHARRLALLRAPLGARAGLRELRRRRASAHRGARDPAQGRPERSCRTSA